jgi:hypothetical protein
VKPSDEAVAHALETSQPIRQHRPRAQFPHLDYVELMDTFAEQLDLVPTKEYGAKGSFVSPPFIHPPTRSPATARKSSRPQRNQYFKNCPERSCREMELSPLHYGKSAPSKPQTVTGEVNFSLQGPLDGAFELPNGNILEVFREYEYLSKNDFLEVYFREDGRRALFFSLKFEKKEKGWVATSDHLCIEDLYKGTFNVAFGGIHASQMKT